jgi:hypothetical protein
LEGINEQEFAQLVSGRRSLRLVVLNACHSAQSEAGGIFAGIGPALVRQRMPAVVAMQQIEPIQNDLTGRDWGALVQHSAQFRKAVKGKILNNRALWRRELQELCALTIQLNSALAGTLVI